METTQVSRIFLPEDGLSGSGSAKNAQSTTSPDIKAFFNMTDPDDKFPILVRHGSNPGMVSLVLRIFFSGVLHLTNLPKVVRIVCPP